jgi:hypothetical protein
MAYIPQLLPMVFIVGTVMLYHVCHGDFWPSAKQNRTVGIKLGKI